MSLLSRLVWGDTRSERRAVPGAIPGPLDDVGLGGAFGSVSEERALRHSAVWSAVWLRAGLMSSFPAHAYVDTGDGRERVTPTPTILAYPTPGKEGSRVAMSEFAAMVEASLCLRGNAYALKIRNATMRVVGLQLLHPDVVLPNVDYNGEVRYLVAGEEANPDDIWHRRRHMLAGYPVGMSAIAYARVGIQLGLSAEEFGARFFLDGAHPTALLKSPKDINDTQAAVTKERYLRAMANRREPLVLGADLDYKQIQVDPHDSQFLDTIGANVTTIARFMRVPPELIGGGASGGGSITYANLADRANHLLVFYLGPDVRAFELGMSEALAGGVGKGQYCKLETDALMRLDPKTQAEVNEIRLRNGETNPDELRALRDLPPLPNDQGQIFSWPPKPPVLAATAEVPKP